MDDNEEFAIDPAIAAAMGFSNFGNQTKKRKHGGDDAFVAGTESQSHNNTQEQPVALSARSAPANVNLPKKPAQNSSFPIEPSSATQVTRMKESTTEGKQAHATIDYATVSGKSDQSSLEALRYGVRDENGDLVIFLPSFIDDPWKHLHQVEP